MIRLLLVLAWMFLSVDACAEVKQTDLFTNSSEMPIAGIDKRANSSDLEKLVLQEYTEKRSRRVNKQSPAVNKWGLSSAVVIRGFQSTIHYPQSQFMEVEISRYNFHEGLLSSDEILFKIGLSNGPVYLNGTWTLYSYNTLETVAFDNVNALWAGVGIRNYFGDKFESNGAFFVGSSFDILYFSNRAMNSGFIGGNLALNTGFSFLLFNRLFFEPQIGIALTYFNNVLVNGKTDVIEEPLSEIAVFRALKISYYF